MASGPPGAMADMNMPGMAETLAPALRPWDPGAVAYMFSMWAVMMAGMMTPSVAPMVLLYAAVGRRAADGYAPFAQTGWFFAGYLAVWITFSALATGAQWGLTSLALLTPMMAASSHRLGGGLLIAAGLYQLTPVKDICLSNCRSPLGFLMARGGFRREPAGAFRLGMSHGVFCLGCCWALMALLFVGGVMNVLWIAGLSILILLEKIAPAGRLLSRISGALLAAAGLWLLLRGV